MFSNLTIRTKLFIIAFAIATVMVLIGLLTYLYMNRVNELGKLTSEVNQFSNYVLEASRAEKEFVLNDQTNPNFFELGSSQSIKRYNKHYNLSMEKIRSLKNNPTIRDYGLVTQLETVDKNFRNYKNTFTELQAVLKEKGYISYGLIGRLRAAAKRIEGLIEDYTNPLLHKEMILTLRGYEKNFLVRKEMRYHKKFVRLIEAYRGSVAISDASLGITESQRAILLAAIDTYREVFETIVGRQQIIGLTLDEGLIGEAKRIIDGIEVDVDEIVEIIKRENEAAINRAIITLLIILLIIAIVIVFVLSIISKSITESILEIKSYVMELVLGKLPENVRLSGKDEIAEMANSLNVFVAGLRGKADFAQEIGKGQFNADFKPLSSEDTLGDSLVEMRERLKLAQEEREKRKVEDDKLNWSNKGLAKFGEILRNNSGNVGELSTEIIEQLVNYVDANQGGVFIYDDLDKDPVLALIASYAYDRRKFIQKQIPVGEGLIGACALEKQRIYLTNLPEDYIEITSGLGDAPPNCLLIVPLIIDQELMGILELASFNEFEEFEIDFVEKVGENIASSLRSAKITEKTNLLLEQFQAQSEELAAQEKEMRKHLDELRETQEEAALKEQESSSFLEAINHTVIKANYSLDGIIILANDLFVSVLGYEREEIVGNHFSMLFNEQELDVFTLQWKNLLAEGGTFEHAVQYRAKKGIVWLIAKYSSLKDKEGKVTGILFLAYDITVQKRSEQELSKNYLLAQERLKTLNESNSDLQKQIVDLRVAEERANSETSLVKNQLDEHKQKEQKLELQIVKASEERELLKLKNKRLEYNETELGDKLEVYTKRIADLEAKTLHMAFQYQYFERAFDLVPIALIVTNTKQEIVYLNVAAQALLGEDPSLIGSHCSVWGSEACNNDNCAIKVLAEGKLGEQITWKNHKYDLEAFVLHDDNGEKLGHLEVITDVTSLSDVESSIHAEQEFFERVLNALPDNIAFKDQRGKYIRINQAMVEFLNLESEDDALYKTEIELTGQGNLDEDLKIFDTKESILNSLKKVELKAGGYKWFSISKIFMQELTKGKPGIVEISKDITDTQVKIELYEKIEKQKNAEIESLRTDLAAKENEIEKLQDEIRKLKR